MNYNRLLLIAILIIASLAVPITAMAYAGENSWDPLYVKIEPTQGTKNFEMEAKLKSQYGAGAFYDCYPCLYKDTSDPYDQTTCLLQTEYCLQRKQNFNINEIGSGDVPNSVVQEAVRLLGDGTDNTAKTPDTICQEHYGQYSYYTGKTNENGNYVCDCKDGFTWDPVLENCYLSTKEKDEECKNNHGPYSFWGAVGKCVCDFGFEMKDDYCSLIKTEEQQPTSPSISPTSKSNTTEPKQPTPILEVEEEIQPITIIDIDEPTTTAIETPTIAEPDKIKNTSTQEIEFREQKSVIGRVFDKVVKWFSKLFR